MSGNYIDHWNANGQQYDIQDAGRGLPLGVATLDNNGRIPYAQLPESAVEFKGYWNASTNTPYLVDGTGDKGDMYYVDVAGQQNLGSGVQYFNVGDRVLYDGSIWKNINSTAVKSVNGVLPDARGNVDLRQNIFSFIFPVGTIYQNASNPTNPATLFGFGTWVEINDKFLVGASHSSYSDVEPKFLSANTGTNTSTMTLTSANIPRHRLQVDTHSHDMTHIHWTNISHGHSLYQEAHYHSTPFSVYSRADRGMYANTMPGIADDNLGQVQCVSNPASIVIRVEDLPSDLAWRISEEAYYKGTQTVRSSTGDSSPYTSYYGGDVNGNTAAFNITPPYQAVYTWKRTA